MRYKGGDTAVRERYDRYIGAIELQYSRYRDMRYKGGDTTVRERYDRYIGGDRITADIDIHEI